MEIKKIFFHYKSFRCKCNGIDVNQGYDISNPTVMIACFGNGPHWVQVPLKIKRMILWLPWTKISEKRIE